MSTVKEVVKVDVPVRQAYNQWTQFEEFPAFMGGVERIEQMTPALTHWVTSMAGITREFDARIVDQVPDQRVAWTTVDGSDVTQAGTVAFEALDATHTRVSLTLDYDPHGIAETVGDKTGFIRSQVQGDLKRFKHFIEDRPAETGGWRGSI